MHSKFKSVVLKFARAIYIKLIRRRKGLIFEGNYSSWKSALEKSSGYDAQNILEKILNSTLAVKRGVAAYERDSVLFAEVHYSWPMLAGIMYAAARNGGTLNVLDFGGSLGSSYFQNRKFIKTLPNLRWNIVEQDHFVHVGQQQIQDEQIRFYSSIETCLAENKPNAILISSTLQYVQSPEYILKALGEIGAEILIIDRTPIAATDSHQLVIQHVPASIYPASYPMWIFSRQLLDDTLSDKWVIIARNNGLNEHFHTSQNLGFSFEGILLEARR